MCCACTLNIISSLNNDGNSLACACLNIGGIGNKNKREELKRYILNNKRNIVLLQELESNTKTCLSDDISRLDTIDWQNEFPGFSIYYTNNRTGILYSNNLQIRKIDIKSNLDGNQWCTWIIVYTKLNKKILIGSYYRSPNKYKTNNNNIPHFADPNIITKDIELIKRNNKFNSIIISGDFNIHSKIWDAYRQSDKINNSEKQLINFIAKNNLNIINDPCKPTHCKFNNIDNIATITEYNSIDLTLISHDLDTTTTNWDTNSFTIYNNDAEINDNIQYNELDSKWVSEMSQHFAISFDISSVISDINEIKYTWRLNSKNWDEYRNILKILIDKWLIVYDNLQSDGNNINFLTVELTKCIKLAAKLTIGIKKFDKNSKGWYDKKIRKLSNKIKHLKRCRFRCKGRGRVTRKLDAKITVLTKIQRKLIKKYKKQYKTKLTNDICNNINNMQDFYKFMNLAIKHENNSVIPPIQRNDGTYTSDTNEKANIFHTTFNSKPKENEYTNEQKQFHNYINNKANNIKFEDSDNITNEHSHILNKFISKQEIYIAMKGLKRKNAMGCDQVHNVMLIEGKDILIPAFDALFNMILRFGKHPDLWKCNNYAPMCKPGKIPYIASNYRALQLSCTMSRVFEGIMGARMLTYFRLAGYFAIWNIAYQTNKSTEDGMDQLFEDIFETLELKSIFEIAFFDLSKAFDTVWINGLLYKLWFYYEIRGYFFWWLKDLLTNRYNRVVIGVVVTCWLLHLWGLYQGGPMSAILFIIYIGDYIPKMKKMINFMAYSDDSDAWLKPNEIHSNRAIALQTEIDNYFNWTCKWKLFLNYKKCQTLTITNKRNYSAKCYKINNKQIQCLHSTKNRPVHCRCNTDDSNFDSDGEDSPEFEKFYNKYTVFIKNSKQSDSNLRQLNPVVRYLGYRFGASASFVAMIDNIVAKNNMALQKIRKLTRFDDICLNPVAIWRFGRPIIQSLIEFGMKYYTVESKDKIATVFNFQYKLARLALSLRSSTPHEYMEILLNFESIFLTVRKRLVGDLETSLSAPPNLIKHHILRQHLKFNKKLLKKRKIKKIRQMKKLTIKKLNEKYNINKNDSTVYSEYYSKDELNMLDEFEEDFDLNHNWENEKYGFFDKTVLRRAFKLKNEIRNHIGFNYQLSNLPTKYYEEKHSIPVNIIPYPSNFETYDNLNDIKFKIKNDDSLTWWSDGSVIDGNYGGYGFVTLQPRSDMKQTSFFGYINHRTNINFCELAAIKAVLCECKSDENIYSTENITQYKYVNIMTDSMTSLTNLSEMGKSDSDYYYDLIQDIYYYIQLFNDNGIGVRLIKIPAHEGWVGNELADWYAKYGAWYAMMLDCNNLQISKNYTPLCVRNEMNNRALTELFEIERKTENKKKRDKKQKKGVPMIQSKLMKDMKKTKCFIEEMQNMSFSECGIISRLRTEHIDLNLYNSVIYAADSKTDPNCEVCDMYETVRHYLLLCDKWDLERADMFYKLSEIDSQFLIEKNRFNILRLLFPHLYQKRPHKLDNILIRVKILKCICEFVRKTKRFVNDRVKSKIFKNIETEYESKNSDSENELDDGESESMIKINDFLDNIEFYDKNFDFKLSNLIEFIDNLHT